MGKLFTLDDSIKSVITDALDDILANTADGGLGKTCLIVYPGRSVPCNNCVWDPIGNKSANRPVSGAPVPFSSGPCPVCGGQGRRTDQATEEITLKCNWEMKRFAFPIPSIKLRAPYSLVEVKGYMVAVPKLLKMDYIVVNLPVAPYIRQKFRLASEPGDPSNIVQGRYFIALLERADG
jgi:hypothetical protein